MATNTFLSGKHKLLCLMDFFIHNTDENHAVSSQEIIDYLNSLGLTAERKSIYNDIEALRLAGFDIICKGRRGGYYLASGAFQLAELKLLVDAVQVSRFITQKKSDELIKKLSDQTSIYNGDSFRRNVVLANRAKTANEHIYYNIDHIHTAIANRTEITFKYMEWTLNKELVEKSRLYRVSPWLLVWDDENYYLVAYDNASGEKRHYRVDKMKDVQVTRAKCKHEDKFHALDPAEYGKATFNMFSGDRSKLKILFDNSLIGVVLDRFGTDITVMPNGKDSFTAYLDIDVSPKFFGWLAGFGNKVKILEPASAANEYKWFILDILKNYQ
ncbi:MAG: WYL domain-containing transcriptional regulator [Firmicutes bacterium]|nr:WYL domain-containing transcriptional regulator [Bacillota bacterium]